MFLLVDGLVLLTCTTPAINAECILGVRFPGQVVDLCAHNLGMPYLVSAITLVKSQIFRISIPELRKQEHEDPRAAAFFDCMLSRDLYNAALFIMQIKDFVPADRLRRFLQLLASVIGSESKDGNLQLSMPLHDSQFAEILGFSPRQFKESRNSYSMMGICRSQEPDCGHCSKPGAFDKSYFHCPFNQLGIFGAVCHYPALELGNTLLLGR